jgi:hypothetical protein
LIELEGSNHKIDAFFDQCKKSCKIFNINESNWYCFKLRKTIA